MNDKKLLDTAKELLKAAKEKPEQFKDLAKLDSVSIGLSEKKMTKAAGTKTKHDRCVEDVSKQPGIKNPHAVCSAAGVPRGDTSPDKTKKEEMGKHDADGDSGEIEPEITKDEMCKDDKPHPPNSPEDKAHDVAEHDDSMHHAMKILDTPEKQKAMLAHLRTLHEPSDLRSPENKAVGKTPDERPPMEKSEMIKFASELIKMAKDNPAKFEEISKALAQPPKPGVNPKALHPGAMPKPAAPAPAPKRTGMLMTKDEIKADLKKPWTPKFKKGY